MCKDAADTAVEEFDVRNLVPAQRNEVIFDHIYELAFGASFILINDHDPKPLLRQLEAEFPGQFFSIRTSAAIWSRSGAPRFRQVIRRRIGGPVSDSQID
jgi:hypothetical protein